MHRRELLKWSIALIGASASASVSRALLAGAQPVAGAAGAVFTQPQWATVNLLSDMIIPPTDTPGAVAAGVPDFIATMVSDWYHPTERDIFFRGLADLDVFCIEQESVPFHQAPEATRVAALQAQEQAAADYQSPLPTKMSYQQPTDENSPFFNKVKELVVLGYYTSEVGATQELAYLPMPGRYDGDYDFAKVGRPWSY